MLWNQKWSEKEGRRMGLSRQGRITTSTRTRWMHRGELGSETRLLKIILTYRHTPEVELRSVHRTTTSHPLPNGSPLRPPREPEAFSQESKAMVASAGARPPQRWASRIRYTLPDSTPPALNTKQCPHIHASLVTAAARPCTIRVGRGKKEE